MVLVSEFKKMPIQYGFAYNAKREEVMEQIAVSMDKELVDGATGWFGIHGYACNDIKEAEIPHQGFGGECFVFS